jgi:hypothetical protein
LNEKYDINAMLNVKKIDAIIQKYESSGGNVIPRK